MIRSVCLVSVLCIFTSNLQIYSQNQQAGGMEQELRRRALVIDIDARVLTDENVIIWNQVERKIAIPGSPVGIRMVGSNVVVGVQFTPFIRAQGNVLVAQVQIWIDTGNGVSYNTSIQTIPIDFNEPIYFFPLGASNSSIEMLLTVNPYSDIISQEDASSNKGNGSR
ncbi:MAG: hypothetical protein LBG94_03845 [Treponema sp.]|jgi:hypothetical protein|nr:hypothetical protein [Treponema sp.]